MAIVAAVIALLAASLAVAGYRHMGVSELARSSSLVVRARVVAVEPSMRPADKGGPALVHRLRVVDVLAGECPEEIELWLPAVSAKGRVQPLPAAPALARGLEFVLFLKDAKDSGYRLVSLSHGAMDVIERDGLAVVLVPLPRSGDPAAPEFLRLPLDDLAEQAAAARENARREEGAR